MNVATSRSATGLRQDALRSADGLPEAEVPSSCSGLVADQPGFVAPFRSTGGSVPAERAAIFRHTTPCMRGYPIKADNRVRLPEFDETFPLGLSDPAPVRFLFQAHWP
jgi:hypothetical protein